MHHISPDQMPAKPDRPPAGSIAGLSPATAPASPVTATAPSPLVRLTGIGKSYAGPLGAVAVLDGIDFSVTAGELCAITGGSGCGKSTLLNLIGLLDRPDRGTLWLCGQWPASLSAAARAELRNRHLGFVFQAFHLLPRLSALDNVALPLLYRGIGRNERRRRALAGLAAVGLAERASHRPAALSGGQRQRVAIARALAGDPALVLADEPTGNLDAENAAAVMDLLAGLNRERGLTMVIVTHDPVIAGRCHRQVTLSAGRIADDRRLR